jgi:PAS domain S-box-containing protein
MKRKIRVLHIDDNLHDRQLVKDALQREHEEYEVVEADNREKFEDYLAKQDFDIVLSDFNILGFDGLQVLQIVEEKKPQLPVIIVTGTGSEEIAIQAMKMGAADYVIKSVKHIQGLVPTIKTVLENKKNQKERKRIEAKLIETESKFRTIFDFASDGFLGAWIDNHMLSTVNKKICEMLGYTEKELLKMSMYDIHPQESLPYVMDQFDKLYRKEITIAQDIPVLKKDKTQFFADVSASLIVLDGKEYLLGLFRDMTERKQTEEKLAWEQFLMLSLMNNIPDAIYFKDLKSRFIRINKAMAIIFGLDNPMNAQGKTDSDFFKNEHSQQAYIDEQEIIRTGNPIIGKEELETWFDRPPTWVSSTKMPLKNDKGNIIGTFGISRDITRRKQVEEELVKAKEKAEESDHLKTAFLHNISHEIRTPMNAIIGFSGFLKKPNLLPEKRDHFVDIIIQSSNQLLSIITDIVNIATIEAGQEKLLEMEVNINSTLKLLFEQFTLNAQKKNITLNYKTSLPDNEALIISDNTKLTEILANLIGNALKFTKQGHVIFGYILNDRFLEFYVEDTGIGVPDTMQQEIFKRFRQVESTVARQFGGSGLGLSISKAYVELLGGKIWLKSTPDHGSIFYFTIPYRKGNIKNLSDRQTI